MFLAVCQINRRNDIRDFVFESQTIMQWRIQDSLRRGAPTLRGGRQDMNLLNVPKKLCGIEKNLVARGGGAAVGVPLDPPL